MSAFLTGVRWNAVARTCSRRGIYRSSLAAILACNIRCDQADSMAEFCGCMLQALLLIKPCSRVGTLLDAVQDVSFFEIPFR